MDDFWEKEILIYTNQFGPLLGETCGKHIGTWMNNFIIEGMYILLPYNRLTIFTPHIDRQGYMLAWHMSADFDLIFTVYWLKIELSFHDLASFSITIELRLSIFGPCIDHGGCIVCHLTLTSFSQSTDCWNWVKFS